MCRPRSSTECHLRAAARRSRRVYRAESGPARPDRGRAGLAGDCAFAGVCSLSNPIPCTDLHPPRPQNPGHKPAVLFGVLRIASFHAGVDHRLHGVDIALEPFDCQFDTALDARHPLNQMLFELTQRTLVSATLLASDMLG